MQVSANKEVKKVLSERQIKILEAIIKEYIKTGEPVGSRSIAKNYDLGISSATIRNEMADLEDLGYIEQLHSSSGRIPSDKGYRLYVDKMMHVTEGYSTQNLMLKNDMLVSALYEVDRIIKEATLVLSRVTKLATVVKSPSVTKSYIRKVQLMQIDDKNLLAVIVTDGGIRNNMIPLNGYLDNGIVIKLNDLLNFRLVGLTIDDIDLEVINFLQEDLRGYEEIFSGLIPTLYRSLKTIDSSNVYSEGVSNMLDYPEFNDIQKAKEFIEFINDEENVKSLMASNSEVKDSNTLAISIGKENVLEGAKECTVITANYRIDGRAVGSIGVIGPTRMNYDKVIATLNKIVDELNISLDNIYNKK